MYEKRATLGDSDFSLLNREHVHYYELNTVIALSLMVVTGLVYGIVTNTLLAEYITTVVNLTS